MYTPFCVPVLSNADGSYLGWIQYYERDCDRHDRGLIKDLLALQGGGGGFNTVLTLRWSRPRSASARFATILPRKFAGSSVSRAIKSRATPYELINGGGACGGGGGCLSTLRTHRGGSRALRRAEPSRARMSFWPRALHCAPAPWPPPMTRRVFPGFSPSLPLLLLPPPTRVQHSTAAAGICRIQ